LTSTPACGDKRAMMGLNAIVTPAVIPALLPWLVG